MLKFFERPFSASPRCAAVELMEATLMTRTALIIWICSWFPERVLDQIITGLCDVLKDRDRAVNCKDERQHKQTLTSGNVAGSPSLCTARKTALFGVTPRSINGRNDFSLSKNRKPLCCAPLVLLGSIVSLTSLSRNFTSFFHHTRDHFFYAACSGFHLVDEPPSRSAWTAKQ
jgi:hypothetical protein